MARMLSVRNGSFIRIQINVSWIHWTFFVRDDDNEKLSGFNLKQSILRARYRPVFEDITFYVSPSVQPSTDILKTLIEAAGGKVLDDPPTAQQFADAIMVVNNFFDSIAKRCDYGS